MRPIFSQAKKSLKRVVLAESQEERVLQANNESDPRFNEYWQEYYRLAKRRGISQEKTHRLGLLTA